MEGGVHVPWHFRRRDGDLWGLAGLYNDWTDPVTGEIVSSYTMLTLNCNGHPLLSRMRKLYPKLSPDRQDKRTVVPLELSVEAVARWKRRRGRCHHAGPAG